MQLVLIGIAAGFFSALFGVGGGIVIVPLLLLTGRWVERPAMATSLAAIGIIAIAGTVSYGFHGELKPGAAALVGLPAAVGAIGGTALQQRLAQPDALPPLRAAAGGHRREAALLMDIALAIGLGLLAGVVAGLFGVGGGILFVPTLTLGLGLTQIHAEATSLLAIIPTVIAGTWRQQRYGNVRWRPAVIIGLAAIGGVEAGVALAEELPEHILRKLFGVLMIVVAAQIAWRARRQPA